MREKILKYLIVTIFFLASWPTYISAQVAVIAHKSVPVEEIKKLDLLDFYTGDVRLWINKEPVVVLDLKTKGEVRDTFYKFLGKSPSRLKSIWLKKMLSGEGDPPEALKTEEEMLKKVASMPGAIGFVSQRKVTEDVKVLIVMKEVKEEKKEKEEKGGKEEKDRKEEKGEN